MGREDGRRVSGLQFSELGQLALARRLSPVTQERVLRNHLACTSTPRKHKHTCINVHTAGAAAAGSTDRRTWLPSPPLPHQATA